MAVDVPGFIASETVRASNAWHLEANVFDLLHRVKPQLKDAGILTVEQSDADTWRVHHGSQRLQVEAPIHDHLGAREPCWQIEFLPHALRFTGEDRFCS